MKKILKFLIAFLLGFVIFGLIIKEVGLWVIFETFNLIFSFQGMIIIFLTFLIGIISIFRWKTILKSLNYNFSFKKVGEIWIIGFSATYLTPTYVAGGEFFKIYLAKKFFPLPLKKSAASVAIDKILDGTLFLTFLIAGILAFFVYGYIPSKLTTLMILLIVFIFTAFLGIFYFKSLKKESTLEWLLKIFSFSEKKIENKKNNSFLFQLEKEIIQFFSFSKVDIWRGIGLSFLRQFLFFLRAMFLIFFLKNIISPGKALAVYGFLNLASLIPLPLGLGSLEAAGAFSFQGLKLGFAAGSIFSMVWRGADFFLCLIGVLIFLKIGTGVVKIKILEFFDKFKKKENHKNFS